MKREGDSIVLHSEPVAVIYCRVSGLGQVDGDGFTRQLTACRSWAESNGYSIKAEYREEGISGKTDMDGRPAFQQMITDLLANGCRTILCESLDRLAREYRVQEQLLIYLASKGIGLIPVNTGENVIESLMGDPMRRALVQIQGIFAELDKNMTVRKLRGARKRKKEQTGRCEGRKPFGDWPAEASALNRIHALARDGNSPANIAATLNVERIPTRYGGEWFPNSVARILKRGAK
jgi:site-specific DNA recombinase